MTNQDYDPAQEGIDAAKLDAKIARKQAAMKLELSEAAIRLLEDCINEDSEFRNQIILDAGFDPAEVGEEQTDIAESILLRMEF